MDSATIVSVSAVLIALLTFVATLVGMGRTAKADEVEHLRTRCEALETALEECRKDGRAMMRELISLRSGPGQG